MRQSRLASLAFGAAIVWSAFSAVAAPAPELSVSQWADEYRIISAESGAKQPGKWRTSKVPFTREVMDTMGVNHPSRRVWVRASAQSAKTQCLNNTNGHCIHMMPRSIMLVAPSGDKAKAWNREQFQPMVDSTEQLRDAILPTRSRSEDGSTTMHKRFRSGGGFLKIVSAQTENQLQSSSIGLLIFEEPASYPLETDGRGDPIDQARQRQSGWGDEAKEIGAGTTGEIGSCRVTENFESGDQRRYVMPCPHCGDYSELVFEAMRAGELLEDGTRAAPEFVQPCCGCTIGHADVIAMLTEHPLARLDVRQWPDNWQDYAGGIWIAHYPGDETNPAPPDVIPATQLRRWRARSSRGRHPSFHWWQGMSPFVDWADIWSGWEATKADPDKLVSFYQQVLALPYEPAMDRPKAEALLDAVQTPAYQKVAQVRRGRVPDWAPLVAGAADVQIDRIEWATWAFGPAEYGEAAPGIPALNAALVDWGVIPIVPEDPRAWAELSQVRNRTLPSDRFERLTHDRFGVDTGGAYTGESYSAIARHAGLMALKGSNQMDAPSIQQGSRVRIRKAAGTGGRKIQLYMVGGHGLKKRIYFGINQGLASVETGRREPGALYLPAEADGEVCKQITAEYLKDVTIGRRRVLVWDKPKGVANEQLDLSVYAHAVATTYGLDRMRREDWDALAAGRTRKAGDEAPMEALWAGNGVSSDPDAADDDESDTPAIVARKSNSGVKSKTPDWVEQFRKRNASLGGRST